MVSGGYEAPKAYILGAQPPLTQAGSGLEGSKPRLPLCGASGSVLVRSLTRAGVHRGAYQHGGGGTGTETDALR